MITLSKKSLILIQSLSKELDTINKRIFAIKNSYYQISNLTLRKRLSKEYKYLYRKFKDLKDNIILFEALKEEDISYSSILVEKYSRCEKSILNNNKLFFV